MNRGVAQIQAVLLLMALAIIGSAVALSFGSEITYNVIDSDMSCHITQKSIYKTGEQKAYVIISVHNTGTVPGDVTVSIPDDMTKMHVIELGLLHDGQTVQQKIPLDANMTAGEKYMLHVTMISQDEDVSSYDCSDVAIAK